MLSIATLGLAFYGLWETARAAADLVGPRTFGFLADAATLGFGAILLLAAAFVRVRLPGGLALAIGALLGLQALALHSAARLEGEVRLAPQLVRGALTATLVLLAFLGSRREQASQRR